MKQLRQVIYSREGITNEALDNDDIEEYRKDFAEFDKDHSGQIAMEELITAMESVGRKVHLVEFMRVVGMADQNLDSVISFAEFVNLFETAKFKRELLSKAKSAADQSDGGGGGGMKPSLNRSRSTNLPRGSGALEKSTTTTSGQESPQRASLRGYSAGGAASPDDAAAENSKLAGATFTLHSRSYSHHNGCVVFIAAAASSRLVSVFCYILKK